MRIKTTEQSESMPLNAEKVRIKFKRRGWVSAHELLVDPSEPSEFQRVAEKYLRKGVGIFDHQLRVLTPRNCLERVTSDKTYAIYLLPNWEVETIHQLPEETISGQGGERMQNHKRHRDNKRSGETNKHAEHFFSPSLPIGQT